MEQLSDVMDKGILLTDLNQSKNQIAPTAAILMSHIDCTPGERESRALQGMILGKQQLRWT